MLIQNHYKLVVISIFLCYLFIYIRPIFFCFFVFITYKDAYSEYSSALTIKELKDFIFKNYYRRIGFTKENNYYSMKHWKKKDLLLLPTKFLVKISDASNAKEYYRSFFKNKSKKLVKWSKIITQQPKALETSFYWHKISCYRTFHK